MSWRWALTPARRSFPEVAMRRFWVFSSTPSPALEMYSRREQSTVTGPCTPSRNVWAAGHCEASRRPAITTCPSAPNSIASIRLPSQGLAKREPALPALLVIGIVERVDHAPHQVQSQSAGFPPLQGQVHVGLGDPARVEPGDSGVQERNFHPARHLVHGNFHVRVT